MPSPVGYTCPTIDSIIENLEEASELINHVSYEVDGVLIPDLIERLDNAANIIKNTYGRRSYIEEVRSANEILRSWGEGLERELEEAREEIKILEEKLSEFE